MTTDKQLDTPFDKESFDKEGFEKEGFEKDSFEQDSTVDNLTSNTEETTSDLAAHSLNTETTDANETKITVEQDDPQILDEVDPTITEENNLDNKMLDEDALAEHQILDIGETLRTKREELGLDSRQVATELKFTIDQVKALEDNHFTFFRSMTFARGFLKSYCRLLDIDNKDILAAFDQRQSQGKPSIQPVDKVAQKQSHLGDPIVIFISVVIIAVLLFFVFWWPSQNSAEAIGEADAPVAVEQQQAASETTQSNESTPGVAEPENTEPKEQAQSVASIQQAETQQTQTDVEEVSANSQSETNQPETNNVVTGLSPETVALFEQEGISPDEVVKATQEKIEAPVEQSVQAFYLDDIEITYDDDCWTEIRDASGKILFSGVKTAGSELSLTGEAPYRVVFGYSRGVSSLKFKGQAFDFSPFVRQDLARFELK
ncbi:RodZ domain-containing protein [Marinomonas sp. THO17]|uniref:RodZ domain-containing protein n=1 Tax=Marinomonas sp. THO17 TaxID=3149048 RepID=UPI00336C1862